MRLDNAAKIYPAVKRKNWSNRFRLSATLKENIDPDVLQEAVGAVLPRFPSIAVCLKRGVFWYYLEGIDEPPKVCPDGPCPLGRLDFNEIRKCTFRVLYYKNRIAVEFFHAITDGNGGMVFLKTVVAEYIQRRYHVDIETEHGVLDVSDVPTEGELEDSFLKNSGNVSADRREKSAYKLRGTPEEDGFLNLITGIVSIDDVKNAAKKYNVSVTAYLVSVLMMSIIEIQNGVIKDRKRQKMVKVLIPVNLRKMFKSDSLRNFVLYITPEIDPRMGDYTFEEIVKSVHYQMGAELTEKRMAARITANVKAEKLMLLKLMPLFIKNAAMKIAYSLVGERKSCLSFSNLGVVSLPETMLDYVDRMDFILGVQSTRPNNCGVISYNGKLYINFIRNIEEPTLERVFFRNLRKHGIIAKIESNQRRKEVSS